MPRDELDEQLLIIDGAAKMGVTPREERRRTRLESRDRATGNAFLGSSGPNGYQPPSPDGIPRYVPPMPNVRRDIKLPTAPRAHRGLAEAQYRAELEQRFAADVTDEEALRPVLSLADVDELLQLLTPFKYQCEGCGRWHDIATSLPRLRTLRMLWLDELQQRAEARHRDNPQVRAAALAEQQAEQERLAEVREERERRAHRQQLAERTYHEYVGVGMSVAEAHAAVTAQYGEDW